MSPTILIVSNTEDAHATAVHARLKERAVRVHRLDSDAFTSGQEWRIRPDGGSISTWSVSDVDVVWYRKVRFPIASDAVQSFVSQEMEGLLDSILSEYRESRWVNHRDCLARARPKIAQLQEAAHLGLRIPDSIITSDIRSLQAFSASHGGEIVAKPIRAQVVEALGRALVIGTRRLSPDHFEAATACSPCFAQERLQIRFEVRVIVFGRQCHSFRLTPKIKADDLKQLTINQIEHERWELDSDMERKVLSLVSRYGLEFAAVDLAIVDEKEPVFLELNPNGQWLWLQYVTGENLIDPFIDLLCS